MKKIVLIVLLTAAFGCGSDSNNEPNNGTTNNGTTVATNNLTTTNNKTSVATNNGTGATNNSTGTTNNGSTGTTNGTTAGLDFIAYPLPGKLIVQLDGGPYIAFEEPGETLGEFAGYDGINWTINVDESAARFVLEDSIGAELTPGIHEMSTLFLKFTIDTDFEDTPLSINLSNGMVEIETIDTATGAIKLRFYSVLSTAETGLAEEVILNAAFDLLVPTVF